VALKRTQKAGNVVSREYEILSMLKGSPNVIQLVNFFYSMSAQNKLIQNTVMEFCDCSLEDKLRYAEKQKKPMSMEEIKCFTK
jgi:serine/threonine protein kinase